MSEKRHCCGMAGQELDTALLGGQQRFWHQLETNRAGKEEIIHDLNGSIGWTENCRKQREK